LVSLFPGFWIKSGVTGRLFVQRYRVLTGLPD
jgi:hypothetical protein